MPVANVHLLQGHPREALREIIIGVSEAMSQNSGSAEGPPVCLDHGTLPRPLGSLGRSGQ